MSEQNDVIRITIIIEMPTSVIANWVYYLFHTSAASQDDQVSADAEAIFVADAFNNSIQPTIADSVSLTRVDWAVYDPVLQQFNTTAQAPIVGAVGGSPSTFADHKTSGTVKFFTPIARRQGRKSMPGINENAIANTVLNAQTLTQLVDWGLFMAPPRTLLAVNFQPGVFSETLGFLGFTGSVEANAIAGSTYRRKPGVGI